MWDKAAESFKFDVGDKIRHKSNSEITFVVTNRSLVQCHGGIQRNYDCMSVISNDYNSSVSTMRVNLNESEVEGAEQPV